MQPNETARLCQTLMTELFTKIVNLTALVTAPLSLHKKLSFALTISSVNVTRYAGNCGFGHIYWRNPYWKTPFFVQCIFAINYVN